MTIRKEPVLVLLLLTGATLIALGSAFGSWMSLGWHFRKSGFLWGPPRYDMYRGGLLWQFVDVSTAVVCGFYVSFRLTWLTGGLGLRVFGMKIPGATLGRREIVLLIVAIALLVNAFRLANGGFPPWEPGRFGALPGCGPSRLAEAAAALL